MLQEKIKHAGVYASPWAQDGETPKLRALGFSRVPSQDLQKAARHSELNQDCRRADPAASKRCSCQQILPSSAMSCQFTQAVVSTSQPSLLRKIRQQKDRCTNRFGYTGCPPPPPPRPHNTHTHTHTHPSSAVSFDRANSPTVIHIPTKRANATY